METHAQNGSLLDQRENQLRMIYSVVATFLVYALFHHVIPYFQTARAVSRDQENALLGLREKEAENQERIKQLEKDIEEVSAEKKAAKARSHGNLIKKKKAVIKLASGVRQQVGSTEGMKTNRGRVVGSSSSSSSSSSSNCSANVASSSNSNNSNNPWANLVVPAPFSSSTAAATRTSTNTNEEDLSWRLMREQQDADFKASLAKDTHSAKEDKEGKEKNNNKGSKGGKKDKEVKDKEEIEEQRRIAAAYAALPPEPSASDGEEKADSEVESDTVEISFRVSLANYADTVRIQRRFSLSDPTDHVIDFILGHEQAVPVQLCTRMQVSISLKFKI